MPTPRRPKKPYPPWNVTEGRYKVEVYLGLDGRGKRVYKRFVGPRGDKSDAAARALKHRVEEFRRTLAPRQRGERVLGTTTLGAYLEGWIKDVSLSESAQETYQWAIDKYLTPRLGSVKLHALNRKGLRSFFSSLTNLGPASKQKIHTVLCAALRDAVNDDTLAANPALKLNIADQRTKRECKEILAWSKSEAQAFLSVIKDTKWLAMILIQIRAGLGPAETFGLQWRDLDLDTGRLVVVRNLTEVRGHIGEPRPVKRRSRKRGFRVPDIALNIFRERHEHLKPLPNDYIFTASEGGPIRTSNFRKRIWYPLLKKAGVRRITLRDLRHSAVSIGQVLGLPLLVVSRMVGHANIRLTADTYSHIFDETEDLASEKFDAFFEETFQKKKTA